MSATTHRTRPGRPTAGPGTVRPRRSTAVVTGAAGLGLVAAVLAGIWVGAVPLAPGGVVLTLADRALGPFGIDVPGGLTGTQAAVLLQLRLPRVVLAVLVGAALAVSGAAYQGVFRNPLADPYLLGAAAGAGLGATLTIAYSPVQSLGPVGIVPLAAFAGALFGVFCALALGSVAGGAHSPTLLLAGIAVNALWPRATIATAAIKNLLGGERVMKMSRTPAIMADAAYAIFHKPAKSFTGHFLIDDTFLSGEGVTDFEAYRAVPGEPLAGTFFVPDSPPPPPGVSISGKRWE